MMLNVGLTGGIACGKSTVARMLAAKGAIVIDFDELAHAVIEPGQPAWQGIVQRFGKGILRSGGGIDRRKLGAVVFADAGKREILNALVHPAVFDLWRKRLGEIGRSADDAIVISDIPLLIEAGLQNEVDLVLLVYLSPEEQIRRLMSRDGFDREEAQRRIASQMPIDRKVGLADLLIDNSGSPERTGREVDRVWEELCRRRCRKVERVS